MKGFFTLIMCIPAFVIFSQTITVTGIITDATFNEPIIGATVIVQGNPSQGTVTDIDGNYVLSNVPANGILEFSYVGMKSQAIPVNGQTTINVVLGEDTELLDEVVVVGYGVQKKSSLTGSVASISSKEIQKQVTSNVASALQGRTPGVEILQKGAEAGGDINILIRGAGTFGSTDPLYVIDGAFSSNGLNSLNAADIESIEILKDGAAAAIYGSRAANGVVLITTKHGKSGKTLISIDGSYSYQTPSKLLNFMNADQWRNYANMLADNSNGVYQRAPQNVNPTHPTLSTDWQNLYYQNAPMWNTSASISGGGENSTYSTSIGYIDQKGIIIESDFKKYNARINGTYKKGILSIQENLAVAHTYKKAPPVRRNIMMPTLPVTDDLGRYVSSPANLGYTTTNVDITNPLADIYLRNNYVRKTDITGSLGMTIDIHKGLKYKLNLAASYLNNHGYTHVPTYATLWNEDGSPDSRFSQPYTSLSESRGETFNYTIDNLLTYNNTFGKHTFDALLGTSWMRDYLRNMSISSGVNDLGAPTITTYNGAGVVGSNELNSALLSYFGRINYDYADTYLLSLSIRRDESSKFAKGHRSGYFPSLSAGWNMNAEPWFENPVLSKLKLRASYGELGANFIDPYSFLSLAYGPIPTIFNNTRYLGAVTRFAQTNLTWETAVSTNGAIELGFLNNELTFTAEYFLKRNNDLLAPLESLPSSGQTIIINDGNVPWYNTASVENKGWEFTLGYRKTLGDFYIDAQSNITFIKNKVLALGEGVQPIRGNLMSSKFNDRPSITQEGLPIGTFWGYKVAGINESGDFIYQTADGIAKPAADVNENDKQVLGNPTPDFTYGLNLNLGFKNWDLTAFMQGTQGNEIFAGGKYFFYFHPNQNNLVNALNAWTTTNKNTNIPIAKPDNYNGGNALPSSFYIEDGSYFRFKNLQLGYSFDKNLLGRTNFIQSLRVYAGIQNLFTITKYSLYDPEVSSNTLFDRGIDGLEDISPAINARVFNIGFNLTF